MPLSVSSFPGMSIGAVLADKAERTKPQPKPTIRQMERWMATGIARATDGCKVEPDGQCPHGKPSWLIVMGII